MYIATSFALLAFLALTARAVPRPQDASVTAEDPSISSATAAAVDPASSDGVDPSDDDSSDVIVDVTVTQTGTTPISSPTGVTNSDSSDIPATPDPPVVSEPGPTDLSPVADPTDPAGNDAPSGAWPSHTFSFNDTLPSGAAGGGSRHHFHHWTGEGLAGSDKAAWSGFSGAARPTGVVGGSSSEAGSESDASAGGASSGGEATGGGPVALASGGALPTGSY